MAHTGIALPVLTAGAINTVHAAKNGGHPAETLAANLALYVVLDFADATGSLGGIPAAAAWAYLFGTLLYRGQALATFITDLTSPTPAT